MEQIQITLYNDEIEHSTILPLRNVIFSDSFVPFNLPIEKVPSKYKYIVDLVFDVYWLLDSNKFTHIKVTVINNDQIS